MITENEADNEVVAQPKQDTFEFKNLQTGKVLVIPKKVGDIDLQELIGHTISGTRNMTKKEISGKYGSIEQALNEKNATLEQLQAKFQEIEESQLSEQQRMQKQYERQLENTKKELATYQEQANKNFSIYQEEKIQNDIIRELSKYNVNNPSQAYSLIRNELKAKLIDEEGNFKTRLYFDDEELQPVDAVQRWISLPENSHHLKNNLRSGGGTNTGTKAPDGTTIFKSSDLHDPAKRKVYLDMIKKKMPVNIID